jgi:predicted RNase H-like nuclease
MSEFIGVDGCKAGWFAVTLDKDENWKTGLFFSAADLWEHNKTASLILIDIPIGLSQEGQSDRKCDRMARQMLGPGRSASIFTPPCREALSAISYVEACAINQQITGKKISIQTWFIMPKINEVDKFIRTCKETLSIIKEAHPEICFSALAGGSMKYNKNSKLGFQERRNELIKRFPQTDNVIKHSLKRYRRKDVKKDDILDALVNAITAKLGHQFLVAMPKNFDYDLKGIPMAIWYYKPNG